MFRKREVTLQVRKASKPEDVITVKEENSKSEKLMQLVPKILVGGVIAVYGYVLLDTYRQVTIAQNTYQTG